LGLDFLYNQEHKGTVFKQGIVNQVTSQFKPFSQGDAMDGY